MEQKNNPKQMNKKKKTLREIVLATSFGLSLLFNSCNLFYEFHPMIKDGDYPGLVVLAYEDANDEVPKKEFTELIKGNGLEEAVQTWFENRAKEYNKNINIPLSLYSEEIRIPEEFIDRQSDFPIDIANFTAYLRETHPEMNRYDFISIIYQMDWDKVTGKNGIHHASYALPISSSIVIKYFPEYSTSVVFAHEFTHLLGATDKYGNDNYDNSDIMKGVRANQPLDETIKITKPTSREIGWEN